MKTDHQAPEAVQGRAEQEDPIVMYLIVKESLGMGVGKACAQVGHAVGMLIFQYYDLKEESRTLQKIIIEDSGMPEGKLRYAELSRKLSIMGEWKNQSYRKVTLKADDREWDKLKIEFKEQMVLVIDAGLTEVMPGSETCIGIWPMRKGQRPKILTRLQVLK